MLPYNTDFNVRCHTDLLTTFRKTFPNADVSVICRNHLFNKIKTADINAYLALLEKISGHTEAKPITIPNPKALMRGKTKGKRR